MAKGEDLRILIDGLERLLKVQFIPTDTWDTGRGKWEADRRMAIEALISEIHSTATEQP